MVGVGRGGSYKRGGGGRWVRGVGRGFRLAGRPEPETPQPTTSIGTKLGQNPNILYILYNLRIRTVRKNTQNKYNYCPLFFIERADTGDHLKYVY